VDLMSMLSGSGGSQVDVVFYLISNKIKPIDIEYMRRLSPLTNVIPLIAQSDKLSAEQIQSLKSSIISELQVARLRPFFFGASLEDAEKSTKPMLPYSISSITSNDDDNMDASLLMSPDYIQPLIVTELSLLVSQVFNRDTISWLRHSAAKKCIQHRKASLSDSNSSSFSSQLHGIPQTLTLQRSYFMLGATPQVLAPPLGATSSYALARITDHTQREERLAQVRLSKWASDLQRSLANERARFEALARGDRAVWLTERLNECVQDGTLVPTSSASQSPNALATQSKSKSRNRTSGTYTRRSNNSLPLDRHDPLGLIQFNADVWQSSWAALRIVGGFGVLGGLAFWFVRNWRAETEAGAGYLAWDFGRLFSDW